MQYRELEDQQCYKWKAINVIAELAIISPFSVVSSHMTIMLEYAMAALFENIKVV